jgi:hypothetical protein
MSDRQEEFEDTKQVIRMSDRQGEFEDTKQVIRMSDRQVRVITKLPNFEQSYKGKVKTHNYINRQNQSTTENCENRNDPHLVHAFLKKWFEDTKTGNHNP